MVKLFKFDGTNWVPAGPGVLSKVAEYCAQGYLVQY